MHEVHPQHVENRKVNLPILDIKKRRRPLFFVDFRVLPRTSFASDPMELSIFKTESKPVHRYASGLSHSFAVSRIGYNFQTCERPFFDPHFSS